MVRWSTLARRDQKRLEEAGFLPSERFRRLLDKEQYRCDRHDMQFALISLQLAPYRPLDLSIVSRLAQIFRSRLRLSDEIGLLNDQEIGILLPHTDRSGATVVLCDLSNLAAKQNLFFDASISVYPTAAASPSGKNQTPQTSDNEGTGDREPWDATPWDAATSVQDEIAGQTEQPNVKKVVDYTPILRYPRWKRALDIGGASIGLLIGAPVLATAAVAIKVSSPGPIFFSQMRTGYGGEAFRIYKLRTMICNADEEKSSLLERNERDGPAFKLRNDPRITTVGKFLRLFGFDELPQLWNVLRGDMGLVGPRPLPCEEANQCSRWQQRRHTTKPGLTCTWQILKSRDVSFDDWMRMDLRYCKRRKLFGDVRLLVQTVVAVVQGRVEH